MTLLPDTDQTLLLPTVLVLSATEVVVVVTVAFSLVPTLRSRAATSLPSISAFAGGHFNDEVIAVNCQHRSPELRSRTARASPRQTAEVGLSHG